VGCLAVSWQAEARLCARVSCILEYLDSYPGSINEIYMLQDSTDIVDKLIAQGEGDYMYFICMKHECEKMISVLMKSGQE